MENNILGLHHITAIADNAKRNYEFYTSVMGLRLVKKTVNFDDPRTYHFYFGNETGTPGTILTFFPWEGIGRGRSGTGMATAIGYTVPAGSLDFWKERFDKMNVIHGGITEAFGEQYLPFEDPDGLKINLVVNNSSNLIKPWETESVKAANALRGFHNIVLTLKSKEATATILTEILGYRYVGQEGNFFRYMTDTVGTASIVDLEELPDGQRGQMAAGTNHHVAFRVKDESVLMAFREKIQKSGIHITEKINRDYFFSLYFREPGGVLFELATDNPGFATDETVAELGSHLRLPVQYQEFRAAIEAGLPAIN